MKHLTIAMAVVAGCILQTRIARAETVVATVTVGAAPHSVTVDSVTNRAYVTNYGTTALPGTTVSVIDGATTTDTVMKTISVGIHPRSVSVNAATHMVYVTNYFGDSVSVINGDPSSPTYNTVLTTIAVGPHPRTIKVNPATNRVYVANYGTTSVPGTTVSVIDGSPGSATFHTVVKTIIVESNPRHITLNPTTNTLYVANEGSASVTVINGANDTFVKTIPVGLNPYDIAADTTTNQVYVADAGTDTNISNSISVIDGNPGSSTLNTVVKTIPVGIQPRSIAVNSRTNTLYAANYGTANTPGNTVSVINADPLSPGYNTVVKTLGVGLNPHAVQVNGSTNRIYVANYGSDTVSVIDGATNTILPVNLPTGTNPYAVALNTTTGRIFVANYTSDNVTIIQGPQPLQPFTIADAVLALKAAGGLSPTTPSEVLRLNVVDGSPAGVVDFLDAVRIARKVAGLEANP
jgi:YVTN family beta-propeller protein